MTPRQQRMLDAIRECLLRPAAWQAVESAENAFARATGDFAVCGGGLAASAKAQDELRAAWAALEAARAAYCDERSRTLVGVIEEVLREEGEDYASVAEALGVEYVADGHPSKPGPLSAVLDEIAALRRCRVEQHERDAAVRALLRAIDAWSGVAAALEAVRALYPEGGQ